MVQDTEHAAAPLFLCQHRFHWTCSSVQHFINSMFSRARTSYTSITNLIYCASERIGHLEPCVTVHVRKTAQQSRRCRRLLGDLFGHCDRTAYRDALAIHDSPVTFQILSPCTIWGAMHTLGEPNVHCLQGSLLQKKHTQSSCAHASLVPSCRCSCVTRHRCPPPHHLLTTHCCHHLP